VVSETRVFVPRVRYTSNGWFGEVYADDAPKAYWFAHAFTKWGAARAARRKARKLNRLEKRGLVA
jgi:hypothetical protein